MSIALVVPCYNEASRLDTGYWKLAADLPGLSLIFINDGSTDDTGNVLIGLCNQSEAQCVHLSSNVGKSEAVRLGMLGAYENFEGEFTAIGFIDSDGAFSLAEIERITKIFRQRTLPPHDFDSVWSSRIGLAGHMIQRKKTRHYLGRIIASLVTAGKSNCPYDTQSGFKIWVMSSEFRQCLTPPFKTRWFFEIELLGRWQRLHRRKMRIWEEPVEFWQDMSGSKIRLREFSRIAKEILKIRLLKW